MSRRLPVGAEVVDRGHVRVVDAGRDRHRAAELAPHLGRVAELGVDDLQHDHALQLFVEGLESSGLDPCAEPCSESVTAGNDAARVLWLVLHHGDP